MKVKNWIHREPIIIKRTVLLQEAVKLMKQYDIRHLPVVEDGELIGFVTESDLRQFSFPSMVENIPVHQVMVIFIGVSTTRGCLMTCSNLATVGFLFQTLIISAQISLPLFSE